MSYQENKLGQIESSVNIMAPILLNLFWTIKLWRTKSKLSVAKLPPNTPFTLRIPGNRRIAAMGLRCTALVFDESVEKTMRIEMGERKICATCKLNVALG